MTELNIDFDETNPDADRLGSIFKVTGQELEERMAQIAAASFSEYLQSFGGSHTPSTMKDTRELRLCLLYSHLPDGLPSDDQVGALFRMTRAQTATLIAGARARFGPLIEKQMEAALTVALKAATKVEDDIVRIVIPDSLSRFAQDMIARTQAPPLEKRRDASQTYDVERDTIVVLCERLGIKPEEVSALKWEE